VAAVPATGHQLRSRPPHQPLPDVREHDRRQPEHRRFRARFQQRPPAQALDGPEQGAPTGGRPQVGRQLAQRDRLALDRHPAQQAPLDVGEALELGVQQPAHAGDDRAVGRRGVLQQRGDGAFEERTNRAGVARGTVRGQDSVGWGTAFLDFDNDGQPDLYFVAGVVYPMPPVDGQYRPDQPNALLQNRGDGTFRDVSKPTRTDHTGIAHGLAVADVDGDGFLDLLIANYDQPPALLKNSGNANRWLQVRLVGTRSNRDGIGARLTLSAGGREQTRAVLSGTSFLSQHRLVAHFGLDHLERAESLTIRWPSEAVQTLRDLAANQLLTAVEPA
jgi:hypothetical protein